MPGPATQIKLDEIKKGSKGYKVALSYDDYEEFCTNDYERAFLRLVAKGSTAFAANKKLGRHPRNGSRTLKTIVQRAQSRGLSPEHRLHHKLPPGMLLERVTIQHNEVGDQLERTWYKGKADASRQKAVLEAWVAGIKEDLPRLPPLPAPQPTVSNLINFYAITDYHLGMLSWSAETGADWDLKIAEETLLKWFRLAIKLAPNAERAIWAQMGDFTHFDGILPVTPTHGHVLDTDSRLQKIIRVMIRIYRQVIDLLLETHDKVLVIPAEGNHDISTSIASREWLAALYENEPRIEIDTSPKPYYAHRFGKTMVAVHHGHLKKAAQLPMTIAADFPVMWGHSQFRYIHTGHQHHKEAKEHPGIIVEQHQTLAARDAHASRGGYVATRAAQCITYHEDFGEIGRQVIPHALVTAA